MNKNILSLSLAAVIVTAATFSASSGTAQSTPPAAQSAGARLYQAKCGSCHTLATNRVGPMHRGVFGRRAGAVAGFNYSPALRASNITWNAQTLDQWLQGPQRMVRGSRMFQTIPNATERAAIIAYLRTEAR